MMDGFPVPRPECDHFWIGHLRGGEPLSVRICSLCGDPDWDDLRRQWDERSSARLTAYSGRSTEGFRVRRSFDGRRSWFVELHAFGRYIGLAR